MVQVNKRVEECYEARGVPTSEVCERVVLECDCWTRFILVGHRFVRHPLECGVCRKRFVRSGLRIRQAT